ncbi:GrpB family protein [Bacillus pseudomycoides]|uniref:GrpB family protein n=2 Tax=Bacillus pseudomycoides TaxID=64104 RepID=UPI0001A14F1E|nr:GrpB family protein [Bacillus pseudomycoides]EEM09861.1 Glutamate-rich protein grpB [Bacillus pseudomycoides]PEK21988.1 GrpB family protein [Bacillus pseudomycoides]PEK71104.1 GrpB family protein [Bacillus pseudomycoides]PEP40148.1 GrpB family protein [Bacillus pseudomycoides]PEP43450.1 GrpB family protein [Bacillus pseudomycoides]
MRKIVVVPYENHWGEKFQIESQRLKAAMPEHVKVHHIGSTSVPGLAAKPIVDMIMEVENIESVDHWNECFQQLGYIVKGENGIPGRRFFIHGTEEKRSYHLHVFGTGNPEITRHLAFRDYMMAHCEEAEVYAALKKDLAEKFTYDGDQYTEGKNDFVSNIDEKALEWRKNNGSE